MKDMENNILSSINSLKSEILNLKEIKDVVQICEITRISKLSPAWKFKIHFTRITDVSPAFCNCQVKNILPPQKKKNTKKQKQSFI